MSERVEKTLRCPRDGRTVARIVVDSTGQRSLQVAGGRDGHVASLRGEMSDARSDWLEDYQTIVRQMGRGFAERALRRLGDDDPPRDVPPRRDPFPSGLDVGSVAAGMDPLPVITPCPRCHMALRVVARRDGNSWDAVLLSDA